MSSPILRKTYYVMELTWTAPPVYQYYVPESNIDRNYYISESELVLVIWSNTPVNAQKAGACQIRGCASLFQHPRRRLTFLFFVTTT